MRDWMLAWLGAALAALALPASAEGNVEDVLACLRGNAPKTALGLGNDWFQVRVVDQRKHCARIGDGDDDTALRRLLHHNVARQQESDLRVR